MTSNSPTRRRSRRSKSSDPGRLAEADQGQLPEVNPGQLAEAVAAAVRAHPAVADLDGGPFGAIACYLPGRRVVGVRVGEPGEPVAVSVVVRLGIPLPQLATELHRVITAITGPRTIELTINDVLTGGPAPPPDSPRQHGRYP